MKSDQSSGNWDEPIEKLREKWAEFTDGLFLAIREEEMRIRRRDLKKDIESYSQPSAPLKSEQRRGAQRG
jgi:hypothetical protein